MLFSIYIENIALIKRLSLEPSGGFCAFTGETGAGKSIIIDSLGLLCGARSDRDIIRTGEDEALVEGIFSVENSETLEALKGLDIEPDEDGSITVTRRLSRDGRSVAKINGRSVALSKLKAASALLLSIHGQQDTQAFADTARQLGMLDSFARNKKLLEDYKNKYSVYREIKRKSDELNSDSRDRELRLDMLRYRVSELKKANIKQGEKEELTELRKRLANIEKIISHCGEAYDALYRREGSAAETLDSACVSVRALSGIIPDAESLFERLESLKYELIDIAETLKDHTDGNEDDAEARLDECETRLELIKRLETKYRTDASGFSKLLEEWETELELNENSEEEQKKLAESLKLAEKEMLASAKLLSESRKAAASLLCKRVTEELCELDMPSVSFSVHFDEKECAPDGFDEIEFLISANKGELPKPMSKIASGGELSRIMLCLKCVFADSEAIGTLIFDEIDSGVSGRTSEKIGMRLALASDGGNTQIICVTHSAILAAKADSHYKISKKEADGRTITSVELLDREGRRNELARILGGMNITETVLKAADEMLANR